MSILLKGAKILIPKSSKHNTTADILIDDNGIISAIANDLSSDKAEIVDCAGKYLTLGWFDLRAHFSDPGEEHKEDLQTGLRLAEVSGFTDVAVLPNTKPVVQTKNDVAYIKGNSRHSVCHLHPIAAVTKDARGEELTEMMDLHHSGAVAFSDGHEPIWHTDILMKSLQYLQPFDGVLMNLAQDRWLAMFGTMHEGMASVQLGMKGVPSVAEEIAIQRDLSLLRYAGGKIHFSCVSSAGSVGLIRNAKKEGLDVTCDVAIYQLIYTDADINDYDTKYRVSPPLRSDLDKEALIQGVKDGTIDCIVSNHHPQDEECKKLEFDLSDNGMLAMQTFWPWLLQLNE
ncbi:MAG: dihydroorotase, partial [Bacteroidota bacterium]